MGENLPDSERMISDNTKIVVWTKISGFNTGDYFYVSHGIPTYASVLGENSDGVELSVSGPGTKITINGTVSPSETYDILSIHGPGKARRFA